MTGGPFLRRFGMVTNEALDEDARNYGAACGKSQVVRPKGVLASSALCLYYDGNRQSVQPSDLIPILLKRDCTPRDERNPGDPRFDIRNVSEANVLAPPATDKRETWLARFVKAIDHWRRHPLTESDAKHRGIKTREIGEW